MKHIFTLIFFSTLSLASLEKINSFKADFVQNVTDDKNTTLSYSGHIQAQKPQDALWNYTSPITKDVYISSFDITIIEPEIEQVIIRKIKSNFDFFMMIQNAIQINPTTYRANYKKANFTIKIEEKLIKSIAYKDEFENDVLISFKNQEQNIKIDGNVFIATFPEDFDVVRD